MKNTYINDQSLVNYPFAEGQQLPFPRHAVQALQVAFRDHVYHPELTVQHITVTGVEIGSDQITLALTANGSVYLGKLTAKSSSVDSFSTVVDNVAIHAMMETGHLAGLQPMSVACDLKLDPSCVRPCTEIWRSDSYSTLVIDGYTYPVGECLDIQVAGPLTVEWSNVYTSPSGQYHSLGPNSVYAEVEGWLEAGDGAFVTAQFGTYDMVTSINGVPVRGTASDVTPILEFRVVPLQTEPSGTDTMNRLKFGITNGLAVPEVTDDPDELGPGVVMYGFNDLIGNATVLTVVGGQQIPNCYAESDQSDQPDDETINAIQH